MGEVDRQAETGRHDCDLLLASHCVFLALDTLHGLGHGSEGEQGAHQHGQSFPCPGESYQATNTQLAGKPHSVAVSHSLRLTHSALLTVSDLLCLIHSLQLTSCSHTGQDSLLCISLYTLTITHSHTLTITCTRCYDEINGTRELFSCSISDSHSL